VVGDVEDRVDVYELVGEDRIPLRVHGQLAHVDAVGREVPAAVEQGLVFVNAFVEDYFGARRGRGRIRRARGEQRPAVRIVVEDPRGSGLGASQVRERAGE